MKEDDKNTFDVMIDCTLFFIQYQFGKYFQKPQWFDWSWPKNIKVLKYKPHLGYSWPSPNVPIVDTLNL